MASGTTHDFRATIWTALERCFTLVGQPDMETFRTLAQNVESLVEQAARTSMHPNLLASPERDITMYREGLEREKSLDTSR